SAVSFVALRAGSGHAARPRRRSLLRSYLAARSLPRRLPAKGLFGSLSAQRPWRGQRAGFHGGIAARSGRRFCGGRARPAAGGEVRAELASTCAGWSSVVCGVARRVPRGGQPLVDEVEICFRWPSTPSVAMARFAGGETLGGTVRAERTDCRIGPSRG